jgi:hypothetical protein
MKLHRTVTMDKCPDSRLMARSNRKTRTGIRLISHVRFGEVPPVAAAFVSDFCLTRLGVLDGDPTRLRDHQPVRVTDRHGLSLAPRGAGDHGSRLRASGSADASDRRALRMVIGARPALRRGSAACLPHAPLSRRQALPVARRDSAEVMSALNPAGRTQRWISGAGLLRIIADRVSGGVAVQVIASWTGGRQGRSCLSQ